MDDLINRSKVPLDDVIPDYLNTQPLRNTYSENTLRDLAHISIQINFEKIPVCGGPVRVHLRNNVVSISEYEKFSHLPENLNIPIEWGTEPDIVEIMNGHFTEAEMSGMQVSQSSKCVFLDKKK
ncbi:MAG: hypothetical protein AB8G05_27165 [Oligoflexales bacterium]